MTTPTGALFYDPCAKPLSTTGQFQAGCYLNFYLTGTTTPTDVYADGDLTIPLSQPVTADGNGRFVPIYLNPATVYRVQLYNALAVKLEDTDPYVPLPIPAAIETLISDVATNTANISTLQTLVTSLQTSVAWSSITSVPAPLVALGDSSPPDTGLTFWRDDGTWASPSLTGAQVTVSAASDVDSIGSTFTTIIASIPVTAGQTYAMLFEGDVISSSASTLNTQMVSDQSGVLVQVGGALGFILQTGNGAYQQTYENAAVPGITNPMYNNDDNYCRFYGRFTIPSGTTSVSFQIKCPSGTLTAKAGSYITLTQIS